MMKNPFPAEVLILVVIEMGFNMDKKQKVHDGLPRKERAYFTVTLFLLSKAFQPGILLNGVDLMLAQMSTR